MPENLEEIELRSEDVQEILSKMPSWVIRQGSTVFLFLILLVLCLSWVINYPYTIQTATLITTQIPPQKEFARTTGKLDSIYVEASNIVNNNTVLAVLENPANTEDIYYLKSILDSLDFDSVPIEFPINDIPILLLGDVETAYANFENSYTEYELNRALNPYRNEAVFNQVSLNELKTRLRNIEAQYALNHSEIQLKQSDVDRNKRLLDKGVVSQLDYESKQLELLNAKRGLINLEASISQIRESIANASMKVKGTEITRTREDAKLIRSTLQSFNQLKRAIEEWENLYVLKAEIEGQVSFLSYWSNNQTVNQGDLVFTIIPNSHGNYLAKLKAAAQNSGKIKIGQKVNIKLDNYPDTEFGMLRGEVNHISLTPDSEGNYYIDVLLPQQLITSYNKEIVFKQEMSGVAEIITEDLRLIERFFYQFKSLLDN